MGDVLPGHASDFTEGTAQLFAPMTAFPKQESSMATTGGHTKACPRANGILKGNLLPTAQTTISVPCITAQWHPERISVFQRPKQPSASLAWQPNGSPRWKPMTDE
eukprot:431386-Pelagomonas_calceolata.AAC.3